MNSIISNTSSQQLSLKNFISKDCIQNLAMDCERFRVFDPTTTLFCFLQQVLGRSSCKSALISLNIQRAKIGLKAVSMNTAAYCKAKKRLCTEKLQDIVKFSGLEMDRKASRWKWKNRDIYLIDGTVINLEDTKENRKEFPQVFKNKKQQGQPKIRLLGMFSLSSGSFLDGEIGKYIGKGQSETSLIQKLIPRIKKGSILVLDRFFTKFYLQDLMLKSNLDYVIRARDETAIIKLGRKHDKIVVLKDPKRDGYNIYDRSNASDSIKVRFIKSSIKRKGFRVAKLYIMTSLLDERKEDIEKIYIKRWEVELDIRHLKTTLEGHILRSKNPEIVVKELWVHLLAFNLVRKINNIVANNFDSGGPRKQSFKTSLNMYLNILTAFGLKKMDLLINLLKNETLKSKYRREPRAIKKRNNRYPLLTTSRKVSIKLEWGYSRRKGHKGLSNTEVI